MTKTILIIEKETDLRKVFENTDITGKPLVIYKNKIENTGRLETNKLQNYTEQLEKDVSKVAIDFLDNWADTQLDNGKSIKEILKLTPPYSWWWFIDRWLHKTPYYKNSLVDIIEAIETINFMIDIEEPKKLIVEDAGTLIGKIAKQVSRIRSVDFEVIGIKKDMSGLFESIKPYLIEGYLKPAKFELRKIISKLFLPERNSAGRKIMVVTYGGCWTKLVDSNGRVRKGDRFSQNVIDEIKKERKFIGLDYDWTPSLGIKKMIEKRKFSRPFEQYYDKTACKRTKKKRKEIKKIWSVLKKDHTMRKTFSYKGVQLWPFMKNRIKFAFRKRLPSFAKDYEATKRAIENLKPEVLFMTEEANALGRVIVMAAKENDVNVVAMQHGMIKENHPAYYHKKKDLKNYPIPDKTAVYGKKDKKILTENSFYPKKKVIVTGSPRYDEFAKPKKIYSKKKIFEKLNLDENKKLLVWTTQKIMIVPLKTPLDLGKEHAAIIFEAVKKQEEIQLVIKLHPRDQLGDEYRKIAENLGVDVKIIRDEIDTNELLYSADLITTAWSTTGLEAMMLDKPVIALTFPLKKNPMFENTKAVINVKKPKHFETALKSVLTKKEIQKKLKKGRKRFVYNHVYKLDGKAAKRVSKIVERHT